MAGLKDDGARRDAISRHDRSILVEAGAGSGKTAIMAGRIAALFASGVPARAIAAVTFTELAASELLERVRDFVGQLAHGTIPTEMRLAFPDGLSRAQDVNIQSALGEIDAITCSTIHGFCQRLIKPYPVEANIDPGAAVMDRAEADLVFEEIIDGWLREHLSGGTESVLAALALHEPERAVDLVRKIAHKLRRHPDLSAPRAEETGDMISAFLSAVSNFTAFMSETGVEEPEIETIVAHLCAMADAVNAIPKTAIRLPKMLALRPHSDLLTVAGKFRAFQYKTKWKQAAKRAGLSTADGERMFESAEGHYEACCAAWSAIAEAAASGVLTAIVEETRPIRQRFQDAKRVGARLDFDDLIIAARDLLRDHDDVRQALGQRFRYVLVDEFQDTDPLQTEIFWRLCGDPATADSGWRDYAIRPGALFLVGDPKQAIYRFRGANVRAYLDAREIFRAQGAENLLSISTNFRSCAGILDYVNARFAEELSRDGQPGFTALEAFRADSDPDQHVAKLGVAVIARETDGDMGASAQRDAEGETVAALCASLIGRRMVMDRRSGAPRPCQPGDIALLAPIGTELWRYEEALEMRGVPVASQAGKGLFRRQEVQDLIAVTRVLADRRDTLAFGALLRGPLVGLTEEELADIIWALPRAEDAPDDIPKLDLNVDPALIAHPLARDIVEKLQSLARGAESATPHAVLSRAVDTLRVRPLLLARHQGQAGRALANVDLYLDMSAAYSIRGLRVFAEAMTLAWNEAESELEGRPDAQEEAVSLLTMHSAKGLEWPVVIPVNTNTAARTPDSAVVDRGTNSFFCKVMGVAPKGHQEAWEAEKAEVARERIRLWYVAATRARELLLLPEFDGPPAASAWIAMMDFAFDDLPAWEAGDPSSAAPLAPSVAANTQTREDFAAEAAAIADGQARMVWRAPSRDETLEEGAPREPEITVWTGAADDAEPAAAPALAMPVQGGRERGLILHKLIEEVLTGETPETTAALTARAKALIRALGQTPAADPAKGLSAEELSGCVARTLSLPEIAALWPRILAEFPVYAAEMIDDVETVTAGVIDALTLTDDGRPDIVIDWKSDVAPNGATLDHYRAQVGAYLAMTGAARGLIVLMTSGEILDVAAASLSD